nr:hypothetical protein GCM10020093_078960 [Planobispora longispora]
MGRAVLRRAGRGGAGGHPAADRLLPSIDYFEQRGTPFIVAVNCFDGADRYDVEEVRSALDLDPDVPVLMCDVRRRASAKTVLVTLVEHSLKVLTANQS